MDDDIVHIKYYRKHKVDKYVVFTINLVQCLPGIDNVFVKHHTLNSKHVYLQTYSSFLQASTV